MKEKNSAVNEGKLPSHGWRGPLGEELIQWKLREEHELVRWKTGMRGGEQSRQSVRILRQEFLLWI